MRVTLKYVERQRVGGRTYYYYRRDGKRWGRLRGEPGSAQFLADYHRIHSGFEGNRGPAVPNSFDDAVTQYLSSPEYKGLADSTRSIYRRYLDEARKVFGPFQIDEIKRKHIRAYRDSLQDTPGRATLTIRIISALYDWGMEALDLERNPAKGVKRLAKGGNHKPWPNAAVDRFLDTAPSEVQAVFMFGLHTGQRVGDIIDLQWPAIESGGLNFKQKKTGKAVWVPIHPDLARTIEALPRNGVVMLTTARGKAWTTDSFYQAFRKAREAAQCEGLVFHGLRATAASRLAECGCTTEEIKAITGHTSDQLAAYYARGAEQKKKATAAIRKLTRGTKRGPK